MGKKNKTNYKKQSTQQKSDAFEEKIKEVANENTAEINIEDEQLVAGEDCADTCTIDENLDETQDISGEAMEFDYYKQQLESERQNLEMYKNMAFQLQADFDNYRKRNANITKESKQEGVFTAVNAMLPAYDALVEGLKMITDENVKKGLEMVERVFLQSLAELNITPIKSVGEQFDPKYHNAIMSEESEEESGTVLAEFNKGFITNDGTVVRVATVKVAK